MPIDTQSRVRPESIPRPRAGPVFSSAENVAAWRAPSAGELGSDLRRPLRQALSRHRQLDAGQTDGQFYPIACVALEVTQRCNLDCTLCYLSDHAEMAHDVPLEFLFRRIDTIERHNGAKTPIQLTGGDPTLRSPENLERLCRYIRERGMRSCLMTNGIKANDTLLERLAKVGLDDVAFHVDLTQDRRGYSTEVSLNPVRQAYIEPAQKAGMRILFNTTVFEANIEEMPAVAAFFRRNAAQVTLLSEGATTRVAPTVHKVLFRDPVFALRISAYLISRLWHLRRGLLAGRGRVHRISLLLHNFMDARELERDRCESCVFMVATERGPVSMCVHNARRDADIFAPVRIDTKDGPKWWSASTGRIGATPDAGPPEEMPFTRLKGRLRAKAEAERVKGKTAT